VSEAAALPGGRVGAIAAADPGDRKGRGDRHGERPGAEQLPAIGARQVPGRGRRLAVERDRARERAHEELRFELPPQSRRVQPALADMVAERGEDERGRDDEQPAHRLARQTGGRPDLEGERAGPAPEHGFRGLFDARIRLVVERGRLLERQRRGGEHVAVDARVAQIAEEPRRMARQLVADRAPDRREHAARGLGARHLGLRAGDQDRVGHHR
jgi:hypothetical protein